MPSFERTVPFRTFLSPAGQPPPPGNCYGAPPLRTMMPGRPARAESVLDLVGETPLVALRRVARNSSHPIWAKLEYLNPGGSVKDRIAPLMIDEAERQGWLKPGGTIVEAT